MRFLIFLFLTNVYYPYMICGFSMHEKISFQNGRNLTLIGSLWKAPSDAIVIMAHGSGSNRLARGLFDKIATSLFEKNYNVLTFDFSGHGESQDDIFTLKQSVNDVAAAISYAKQLDFKNIVLLGHSLGAYGCLKNYSSDIKTMILLGGTTGPVDWKWEGMVSPEQIEEMKKTGYISAQVNDGLREWLKIDAHLLDDLRKINQEELFTKVKCPLLIIHGDADQQECDMRDSTQKGLEYFPEYSELKIIPGAEHTFLNVVDPIISEITEWTQQYCPIK